MSAAVITAHQCCVCGQWRGDRHLEPVSITDVPESLYVCDSCLTDHVGPGKFERVSRDDLPFALAMQASGPEDYADHFITDEYQGAAYVIGDRIWLEDERGFVEVRSFPSVDAAMRELNGWEDDGFGASEWDAWINCGTLGYEVSFQSKYLGTYETLRRAKARVSVEMRRTGYFPNVFFAGEHGPSIRRIEVW